MALSSTKNIARQRLAVNDFLGCGSTLVYDAQGIVVTLPLRMRAERSFVLIFDSLTMKS